MCLMVLYFLRKLPVLENVFFLFFFSKIGIILKFPLHWQDDFCSLQFTPILIDLSANGERQTSNLKPEFDVWGKRGS